MTGHEDTTGDTLGPVHREPKATPAVWLRRATTSLLAVAVVLAFAGYLGVRSGSVVATGTDPATNTRYTLGVTYARVARAGLDVPFRITVESGQPFQQDDLTLRISRQYLEIFETQGFLPAAAEETGDPETVALTFTAPPGSTFTVDYDAYIQPSSQRGAAGRVELLIAQRPVAQVSFTTTLLP